MWSLNLFVLFCVTYAIAENRMLSGYSTTNVVDLYNVGIFRKSPSIHICSGVIYKKQAVLSTASCLENIKAEDITVLAGTNDLNEGGKNYNVTRIVSQNKGFNSIAILFVEPYIEKSRTIKHHALPTRDVPTTGGVDSYSYGWMTAYVSH